MVILLMGPSGSGKTTTAEALAREDCYIVSTYTTRPPRPDDKFTRCIDDAKFDSLLEKGYFVSHSSFDSTMGKVRYGIPKINEYELFYHVPVIILAKEYYDDIVNLYSKRERVLKVYLDVDDNTILNYSLNDDTRGPSMKDLEDRLKRDKEKNKFLEEHADIIIHNHGMRLAPYQVANVILKEYSNSLLNYTKSEKEEIQNIVDYYNKEE